MDDSSTGVPEDDQHEQQSERDRRHDEQVGGHNLARVVGEEGPPGLRRRARMPPYELRDGRLTHGDSQLLQFAVDPRRTPERIRGRQLADQGANVCWHARSSSASAASPGPKEAKAASMPGDDGLRPDDVNRRPPAAPGSREPRPQHQVCRRQTEAWPRDRLTTVSWCRSARISRCSAARDRTRNRSEWRSETRTDATNRAYRRTPVTSINAMRTVFLVGTARAKAPNLRDQRCVRRHRRQEPLRHGVRRRLSHPPQGGRRDARTKN